jgi:hypothetical protein
MSQKQTGETLTERYGLGWSLADGAFGHAGACGTDMTIHSDKGLVSVFLVQHTGFIGVGGECRAAFESVLAT